MFLRKTALLPIARITLSARLFGLTWPTVKMLNASVGLSRLRKLFRTDAVIRDGEFVKGIYVLPADLEHLKISTLDDLRGCVVCGANNPLFSLPVDEKIFGLTTAH